ncbi:hypothetical protein [Pseudomonas sp. BF-R-24]|uniref:hypothetical protein n=1 Tax=Pseudomonas sp. BF-R-24 TaxID=2832386 RepID=UPI001CBBD95A|nr:hypothetical protein [Pseudomonas sp. BF-R-24]
MKASLPHKQRSAAANEFALGLLTAAIHLNLPGIGQVPNLPATLTTSASLQF